MRDINFCKDWLFTVNNEQKAITLPHDAQLYDKRSKTSPGGSGHGYFVGNTYLYEKVMKVPEDWRGKHIQILFEGVYKNATVSLNGKVIGSHKYGYTQFLVTLDEHLDYGRDNILSVEVDNSKLPNSRWYTGGGIYRPVHLLISEKEYIAFQGIKVSTVSIKPTKIKVATEASSDNIAIEIFDGDKVIARGNGRECEIEIPDAVLWSESNPHLYIAKAYLKKEDRIIDEDQTKFGIREISWSRKGLFVNGEHTLLRGGCVHHDNGVVGAASFPESEWRRVRILKENGFNAIRSSHNPASTAMLDACDYYGMYVMDESFDMWYLRKTKYDYGMDFREEWKNDIRAMVDRDYNHPSVIMYSIGNEVSEPGKQEGVEQGKEIIRFIKSMDISRPVTGGMNLMIMNRFAQGKGQYDNVDQEQKGQKAVEKEAKNGSLIFNTIASFMGPNMNKAGNSDKVDKLTSPILDALDIAGYNYANGRYPMEGAKHPDRVIVGSETFPYEIAKNWEMVKKYPYLIGDFMWTSWDYLGEAGLGAWSYTGGMPFNRPYPWLLGGAGVIDILGNPDASCGLAKVVWEETDKPVIGVRPVNHPGVRVSKSVWRGTNAIESWSWSGCDGNKAEIDVFAKADSVELFVNGKSIGRKKLKECQTFFKTKYQTGKILAITYDAAGREIERNDLISATGKISATIIPENDQVKSNQVFYVNVAMKGENGITDSNSDSLIRIKVEGGELLGFGSANPCTEEDFLSGEYTTYRGAAQAVIRAGQTGNVTITLTSRDGEISKEISIV